MVRYHLKENSQALKMKPRTPRTALLSIFISPIPRGVVTAVKNRESKTE